MASNLCGGRPTGQFEAVCICFLSIVLKLNIVQRASSQVRRSLDSKFDLIELKNACIVLNTAEYCQVTASEVLLFLISLWLHSHMSAVGGETCR